MRKHIKYNRKKPLWKWTVFEEVLANGFVVLRKIPEGNTRVALVSWEKKKESL